jgi:hypothetical protein
VSSDADGKTAGLGAAEDESTESASDSKVLSSLKSSEKRGKSRTGNPCNINDGIKTVLQNHRAAAQYHRNEQNSHQLEIKRLEAAPEAWGESSGRHGESRREALRHYLVDHSNEVVTTKMLGADPSK